jgi:hypothetical protein
MHLPYNYRLAALAILVAVPIFSAAKTRAESSAPPPQIFYASSSGKVTLDQGEGGGNPFASALIELLGRAELGFEDFANQLKELTSKKSGGRQNPDVPNQLQTVDWKLAPKAAGERRIALVFVFSDYSAGGARSLPGAKRDAGRVSEALKKAGFETATVIDPSRSSLNEQLAGFAVRSMESDVALIYTTGHGVEVSSKVYLLPGNYPVDRRAAALSEYGLQVTEIAAVPKAKRTNLVLYAGCRDNPFNGD